MLRISAHLPVPICKQLAKKNVDRQYSGQFSKDPAFEMRARYWMCCPNDGTEMISSVLQHMPNSKSKIIGQWTLRRMSFDGPWMHDAHRGIPSCVVDRQAVNNGDTT